MMAFLSGIAVRFENAQSVMGLTPGQNFTKKIKGTEGKAVAGSGLSLQHYRK